MAELDLFRTQDHVPDFDDVVADYRRRSHAVRANQRAILDVSYGRQGDERLDLFFPPGAENGSRPVHVFIHGGYWRANRKEEYAFVARQITAAGAIAIIAEYTLMPAVRMPVLVDQVRRAVQWVRANIEQFGGDPQRLTASGHSAGAHLAFYLVARGPHETHFPKTGLSRVLLVSGIYDLAPIAQSFLQAELHLSETEVAQWSPITGECPPEAVFSLIVGEHETTPFQNQAKALGRRLDVGTQIALNANHMTVVRQLDEAGTVPAQAMNQLIVG